MCVQVRCAVDDAAVNPKEPPFRQVVRSQIIAFNFKDGLQHAAHTLSESKQTRLRPHDVTAVGFGIDY